MDVEAVLHQPGKARDGRLPGPFAPLHLVQRPAVMVERDTDRQPGAVSLFEPEQVLRAFHHRTHRVGQHQDREPAVEAGPDDRRDVGVHEGLTACQPDLPRRQPRLGDLVEKAHDVGERQVGKAVVGRARFDIAVAASEVAQRAGVEPKGPERVERDRGAPVAVRRDVRVAKLDAARGGAGLDRGSFYPHFAMALPERNRIV